MPRPDIEAIRARWLVEGEFGPEQFRPVGETYLEALEAIAHAVAEMEIISERGGTLLVSSAAIEPLRTLARALFPAVWQNPPNPGVS